MKSNCDKLAIKKAKNKWRGFYVLCKICPMIYKFRIHISIYNHYVYAYLCLFTYSRECRNEYFLN